MRIFPILCLLFTLSCPGISWSDAPERDLFLENDMVFIPAGQFVFGTNKKDTTGDLLALGVPKPLYKDEHPEQTPFLKGFYIDRFEVTHRRYKKFLQNIVHDPRFKPLIDQFGGYPAPKYWTDGNYPAGQDNYPVVWVTWFDAANFCEWAGKRLPTEKEWERVARSTDGREYPWGNTFEPHRANLPDKPGSQKSIAPVGSFPEGASPLGVHDLIGNVWEWTRDDYNPYPGNNYRDPAFGRGYKVLRGVSVSDIGHFPGDTYLRVLREFARSGYRQFADPDSGAPDVGFRCASSSPPKNWKPAATSAPLPGSTGFAAPSSDTGTPSGETSKPFNPFASQGTGDQSGTNPFEPQTTLPKTSMLALVVLSFVAGIFSFLSPCTLPILPAYFAVTAQASRARMTLNSFAFFCGLASLFVLMGASASLLGSLLRDYLFSLTTWGGVLVAVFGVMTVFGKGFSGATFSHSPATTLFGYFLFGATFALGWTPCVGPVLSGILILAASEKTIAQGMALLFFYAVGLGLPLILIASFCSHLPKDGLFWRFLRGKGWHLKIGQRTILLHTTNLFSGLLLIFLGVALASGYLTYFNSLIPIEVQIWFSEFEEKVMHWFS